MGMSLSIQVLASNPSGLLAGRVDVDPVVMAEWQLVWLTVGVSLQSCGDLGAVRSVLRTEAGEDHAVP